MTQEISAGKVLPVNLEDEMKNSYIDYAMSVIVMRALPDVRDGLKPVHRRILYAMQEAGMGSNKPYKKSARIVGEVLGKYHPHGDSSVYDAIVRMAQDFSCRYVLADGHGNFGSIDGDSAAAMRYTEVRMSKIAELMLQDIDKQTVDFAPNYDESLKEPTVLPSKIPNLLVNGSSGIAVGMATNIPPHNLTEVIDGVLQMIDNPDITIEELMKTIKGPDFPTGAMIMGRDGIISAYKTGRGAIKMRACTEISTLPNGKPRITVTQLPYQVNKARLVERIAELVRNKIIEGITDLNDESDRNGMSIVIDLRRDANAEVILNQLYQHTQLQETFGVIMLALVNGHPRILNLKQVLHYYIKHQEDVIRRRTQYELTKAQARAHILEGLTIALDQLDPIIETIRKSPNGETAKEILMSDYTLTEKQAQAILDLRLQRLTGLEREKIETEYLEVLSYIDNLNAILADEHKILNIIKEELSAVKAKFGDARRTQITDDTSDVDLADLIAEENVVITLTHNNYIKRIPLTTYRNQKRGGRGVTGMGTKEEDYVENMIITSTHNTILFFTNKGLVYQLKGYEIPESGRTAKGTAIVNLLPLAKDESITAIIPIEKFADDKYLFMATRNGVVKKTVLSAYDTNRKKTGLIAISLKDDDELISVKLTDGNRYIIIGTRDGMSISFNEQDVRPMGRNARGVIGIKLKGDDKVIDMDNLRKNCEVLTVTENGYGKRTPTEEYRAQSRGGIGLINIKVTEKTGFVVGVKVVNENQEFMLISTEGIVIRSNINEVSVINRNTQGVKVMNMDDNDKVAAVAAFEDDENSHE
ncbi:DNA gyrase subunit A [Megamonas hypermegale]|uniref:DNA gyrase subunit A n=2 Tax=Megamonas hypermegale TaxID=158847 RepID=A0A239TYI2_9FIRM|nr:DNA gyrase subunit A [Megamonas hypermegale]MBM6761716.1 DNA gyrase subunit A [Megamonas hypermegale]SNV02622.1 DNA gyrase subunit A [Megamonas hypermegale]